MVRSKTCARCLEKMLENIEVSDAGGYCFFSSFDALAKGGLQKLNALRNGKVGWTPLSEVMNNS